LELSIGKGGKIADWRKRKIIRRAYDGLEGFINIFNELTVVVCTICATQNRFLSGVWRWSLKQKQSTE
jgi:hypothetical protein